MSKPRKKRTPQEKFKIVMEGLRGDHGSIAAGLWKYTGKAVTACEATMEA